MSTSNMFVFAMCCAIFAFSLVVGLMSLVFVIVLKKILHNQFFYFVRKGNRSKKSPTFPEGIFSAGIFRH